MQTFSAQNEETMPFPIVEMMTQELEELDDEGLDEAYQNMKFGPIEEKEEVD